MCYCQPQTSKYSGAHGRWAPCPWERGEIPRQSRCCETQAHRYATDHRRSHWLKGREDGYARLSVKSEDRPVCCAQHFFGPKEVRSSPPLFMWRAASCRIIPIIRLFFFSFSLFIRFHRPSGFFFQIHYTIFSPVRQSVSGSYRKRGC